MRIAMELLVTGRLMPAEEALGHGFINRVAPPDVALGDACTAPEPRGDL